MRIEVGAEPDLASTQARAIDAIDAAVGAFRARFLTVEPGQAATYRDKLADCQAFLAATNPALADHPWVAAEADAQQIAPTDAAANVVATYQQWRAIGVAVEQLRLTVKRLIRDATAAAEVAAAGYAGRQALAGVDAEPIPAAVTATLRQALLGDNAEVAL